MNSARYRSMDEAVSKAVLSIVDGIHTAIPGVIQAYDGSKMLADVRVSINATFGDKTVLTAPVIFSVPVIFPRSAKASFTFPLEKGDSVLLIVAERSIDEWMEKGSGATPDDPRRFDLSDAVAIPGCFNTGSGKAPRNKDNLEIQYKNQSVSIDPQGNIEVGNEQAKVVSKVVANAISVELGGATVDPTDGVVTGKCSCCVYGNPHTVVSPIVKAKFTP